MTIACPCCGYDTLTAADNYEVCPICFWEDVPPADFVMRITSNRVTLLQAQRNFLIHGACEAEFATLTRRPMANEQRVPDWQPLDQRLRQQQHQLLDSFTQVRYALIELVTPLINDEILRCMAMADYGMEVELHLAGLRQIRLGEIPAPLEWAPLEVLRLVRWGDPDDPQSHWDPRALGHPGHLQRAFACTALLLAATVPENRKQFLGEEHSTVIQLIASLLTLDVRMQRAGLRLLSERVLALELEDSDLPFFALGILVLAAALPDPEPIHLAALSTWVLDEEARLRDTLLYFATWQRLKEQWLLGLTTFDGCHSVWQTVTARVLGTAAPSMPPDIATVLQTIVTRLQTA